MTTSGTPNRAAFWETVLFVLFSVAGIVGVIVGFVGDDNTDIAWAMGALAFGKASRAMAWLHRGREF